MNTNSSVMLSKNYQIGVKDKTHKNIHFISEKTDQKHKNVILIGLSEKIKFVSLYFRPF